MTRGPRPTPTALKLIQGNPGKRALPKNEPKPKAEIPRMPPELSAEAKKHWRIVAKQLVDMKVLTKIDGHALALYCEAYARWRHANDQIRKYGVAVKAPSGFPIQSPYLAIANKAFDQMRSMLVEFGMTPSARTRVQTVEPKDDDNPWNG